VSGIVNAREVTKEQVGLLMTHVPEKIETYEEVSV